MPLPSVRNVFEECQRAVHLHNGLLKKLRKIYDDMMLEEFWEQFEHHLKFSLIVFQREPTVERTIEFIVKFATSFLRPKKTEAEDSDEEEEIHPFIAKFFDFLLEVHNARDRAVRFRCCQLINKLLHSMGENAQIDDDLYDRIFHAMLYRLKDKFPIVRIQAVLALARLQDPTNKDCPVINAYIFLLAFDPNADVRRAILSTIAASKKTLPGILERARDVKDVIRKQAYQVIAENIHMKSLSIAQRVKLLKDGLNDRADEVKQACTDKLLQAWLRQYGGNILDVLRGLDVEESAEVADQALKVMFSKCQQKQLVDELDLLNEKLVIPAEKLTCENVFYWRCLCDYFKALGDNAEEYLERILPTGFEYCEYIKSIVDSMKNEEDLEKKLENEFILQHLIDLACNLDLADEVGRKSLDKLIHDLLFSENVSHTMVASLLKQLDRIQKDDGARILNLAEVIADIREPISTIETSLSHDKKRLVEVKAASIRVKILELREELDDAVQKQDFIQAGELKRQLAELEAEKEQVLEELQPVVEEVRKEKNDPQTLLKCMTIACVMLEGVTLNGLIPTLQTLIETLILPGIQNQDPAVRRLAVKSLGLCCQMSKPAARAHLLLFIQVSQVDHMAVQVTALEALFDILLTFGLEAFTDESNKMDATEDDDAESVISSAPTDDEIEEEKKGLETIKSLITILTSLIDSEMPEIRTVAAEGLAKLMLSGRVMSGKLLSRLLLLWYNPLTEDDIHLRHCLGTFFPVFAFSSQTNQEVMSEAFLPTLKTIFNAPMSSPLVEVNAANVAKLLLTLTSARSLEQNRQPTAVKLDLQDHAIHNNLAVKACNEILSEPNSFNTRVLTKTLNMLELNGRRETDILDLKVLVEQMTEEVKDKTAAKTLERFDKTVKDFARKFHRQDPGSQQDPDAVADELSQATESLSLVDIVEDKSGSSQVSVVPESSLESQDVTIVTDQALDVDSQEDASFHTAEEDEKMETTKEHEKENKTAGRGNGRSTTKVQTGKKLKKKLLPKNSPPVDDDSSESDLENTVFASPTPVRRSARMSRTQKSRNTASRLEDTKVNLEDMLSDESEEESTSKTPKSKRYFSAQTH
ncbi:condensin complex subunit 3-like isoform X2 [Lineus longissimus]|uniref:condensin complex subunit 3-like isoform X2 n=1 Tax=Lineus longissimus TaxID=88925 RepID=UPI002B4D41A9